METELHLETKVRLRHKCAPACEELYVICEYIMVFNFHSCSSDFYYQFTPKKEKEDKHGKGKISEMEDEEGNILGKTRRMNR